MTTSPRPGYPDSLAPVDLPRVYSCAQEIGLPLRWADGPQPQLVYHHSPHCRLTFSLNPDNPAVINCRLEFDGPIAFSAIDALAQALNEWNHDCFTPTMVFEHSGLENLTLSGHGAIVSHQGLTTAQLESCLIRALSNAGAAFDFFIDHFPEVDQAPGRSAHASWAGWVPESAEGDSERPTPVSYPRLRERLRQMGVVNQHGLEDGPVLAWINEVLVSFAIDSGPSVVINGRWEPQLPAAEFSKLFLTCNDWNRTTEASSAFCHLTTTDGKDADEDADPDAESTVDVHIDYSVVTAEGLTDAQLTQHIGIGLHNILYGLDSIARDVVGVSPVKWPN